MTLVHTATVVRTNKNFVRITPFMFLVDHFNIPVLKFVTIPVGIDRHLLLLKSAVDWKESPLAPSLKNRRMKIVYSL